MATASIHGTLIGIVRNPQLAHVGKNTFTRGLACCEAKKLLSYRRKILTLFDPLTGKPPARWKSPREWIDHANPTWKFDLGKITPSEWHAIVEKLLYQTFPDVDGWTPTTKELRCPFCKQHGEFSVNFHIARYTCHGCREAGMLGQLVKQVRGGDMNAAKQFIQEAIEEKERQEIPV